MVIKTENCSFSSFKIFPGHGRLHIDRGGRAYRFINTKNRSLWHQGKKPQKLTWTQTWRKMHKKGQTTLKSKRRTRKTTRMTTRSIGSFTLAQLKEKRAQKPEFRKAKREEALREAKERKREAAKRARTAARQNQSRGGRATKNTRRGARR